MPATGAIAHDPRGGAEAAAAMTTLPDDVALTRFFSQLADHLNEWTWEIDAEAVWAALCDVGLGERVAYDPAIHGDCEAELGDMLYIYSAQARRLIAHGLALDAEAETVPCPGINATHATGRLACEICDPNPLGLLR